MSRPNTVFVGNKPILNYVLACITLFRDGQTEIVFKARGKAISHAVDVVQVMKNRFLPEVRLTDIRIGTEQVASPEGDRSSNVSTIEITVTK